MRTGGTKSSMVAAVAVGGIVVGLSLPAAAHEARHLISGSSIKKHSIPGNRLRSHTITGKQVKPLRWHRLTLTDGFAVGDLGNEGAPAYALDAQGLVHLKGSLDGVDTSGDDPFTLPQSVRPVHDLYIPVDEGGTTTGRIRIKPTGETTVQDDPQSPGAGTVGFTSLEGVTFWPGR